VGGKVPHPADPDAQGSVRQSTRAGIKAVTTEAAPIPAAAYSQAVVAGGFIFASGQRPVDPVSGKTPEGIDAQARLVMNNLRAVLQAAGTTFADAVKVEVHLANLQDFGAFNEVYAEYVTPPYPARTTVGSQLRDVLVEVDLIAVCAGRAED
jgi:2-iminobutanoate/2-iminopropanoate deaminase